MKAKNTSHIGMMVGAVCLSIVFIVYLVKFFITDSLNLTLEQAGALVILGISPSIPFCPIYISTWLDKFYELKYGNKENKE